MKVKAQVFRGADKPFELTEFPLPTIEPNGLLVKVEMACVCGTDLHIWHGKRQAPVPIILGHEAIGSIETKGEQIKTDTAGEPIENGDRITWSYIKPCGDCYYCKILKDPAGCTNRFVYGLWASCEAPPHLNGAFSEYIYLRPDTFFFKVPSNLPGNIVAPANCALVTMINSTEKANITLNDTVVVQGCGPLGLYGIALAKERGASKVIALDVADRRLEFAKMFGADVTINVKSMSEEETVSRVREMTQGRGADIGLEASGVPDVIPIGLKLLRDGGRYVTVGPIFQGASAQIDVYNLIFRRISLIGTARNEAKHLMDGLVFLSRTKQKYPYDKVVGSFHHLDDIVDGFKSIDSRQVMRAAITFDN
ncbi:MAG TPA: zinc-binding dehydrogenase [Candidatus Bathyarchaeia archaeon]|nr:zinc-binding dehydrogenase [Candidatus Bathyarchaeia archaeon]